MRLVSANPASETLVIDAPEAENLQIYGIVVDRGRGRLTGAAVAAQALESIARAAISASPRQRVS